MEPAMGEGNPGKAITPEFYALARKLTLAHGAMLLVDSIQAGLRATGMLSICDYPGFESLAFSMMSRAEGESIHKMPTGTLGVFDVDFQSAHGGAAALMRHWVRRKDVAAD